MRSTDLRRTSCSSTLRNRIKHSVHSLELVKKTKLARRGESNTTRAIAVDTPSTTFSDWRDKKGIGSNALKIEEIDNIRGTVATRDIKKGDTLVELPKKATLFTAEGDKCPFPELVSEKVWESLEGDKWPARVALCLINQRKLGADSDFFPYINQLPKDYATLPTFTPGQLKQLQYPPVLQEVKDQQKFLEDVRKTLKGTGISSKDIDWAMGAVLSRVFSGQLDPGLKARYSPAD
ncbi:hypothetical protein CYMTET_14532 [Cymbomonas tetramitiformis]|uniref:Uncharacterized protein n=1 Tax=Cymbomonas tetramitiformis TaxID=36881 RepID=A0AAE0GG47_9CHLO|nr:hypothetical protein CYMTET_14532 [Cymbomonas tetramitiformis]